MSPSQVRYDEVPEQFCLGLYPEFGLERLIFSVKTFRVEQRFESSDSGD